MMKKQDLLASPPAPAAATSSSTARGGWWRPQFYRTEDAELVAASYENDQLIVTIANKDEAAAGRMAVVAA